MGCEQHEEPDRHRAAEALLTRREQRLSRPEKQTVSTEAGGAVPQAEALPAGDGPKASVPKSGGRGLVGVAARADAALSARTGDLAEPVVKNRQESMEEARREQERKAART